MSRAKKKPDPKHTKKKPAEWNRTPIGIFIGGSDRAPTYAHQLYRVTYTDGVVETVTGRPIRLLPGYQDLNGTKAEKAEYARELRFDLDATIRAARILLNEISKACIELDTPVEKK